MSRWDASMVTVILQFDVEVMSKKYNFEDRILNKKYMFLIQFCLRIPMVYLVLVYGIHKSKKKIDRNVWCHRYNYVPGAQEVCSSWGGRGRPGFHGMQLPIAHRVLVIRGAATS